MLVLLAALALALPIAPAQEANGPAAAVDAFHAALEAGDRDAALAWLDPDVVIYESGGAEMSREEYASHHLGGDMQFSAAMEREVTGRREQTLDDVAWVLSATRTTGTFRDREIDSVGVETMVLRRIDGAWRIVHVHWSSRSAPSPD